MKAMRMTKVLVALAVLAFSVLFALSSTGWVMRQQIRMLASTFPERTLLLLMGIKPEKIGLSRSESERIEARAKEWLRQIAQNRPDDVNVQIAFYALTEQPNTVSERLRNLLKHFPESATLCAAILRYDCIGRIHFDRKERYLLSESPLPEAFCQPNPKHLAEFEQIAISGERIDPDNAFFPMMRMVALFAANRDNEALEALMKASKKRRWDDYSLEEVEGMLKLWETAFGKTNGLTKICLFEMRFTPYLALLRKLAYAATYKAVELEREGKLTEGLEIRLALMRCAKLMRGQQKSKLPKFVALPIAHIATLRPKGEPLPKETGERRGELVQVRFISYLRQIGQSETADWVQGELQAQKSLRTRMHKQVQRSPYLDQIALAWSIGLTFLSAVAILLAMWLGAGIVLGVEKLALRSKQIGSSEQQPLRLGAILVFAIWLLATIWLWKVGAIKFVWSIYEVALSIEEVEQFCITPQLWQAFLLTLVAVGTLLLAIVAGLWGRLIGVPISRGIVQGTWRWSLPAASLIFLLYAVNLIATAIWEGRLYLPL